MNRDGRTHARHMPRVPLMPRMFGTYCAALFVGIVLIEMQNIIVWNISFRELLKFNIPAVIVLSLLFVLLLQAGTWFRLRLYRRYAKGDRAADGQEVQEVMWRLLRFPQELFAATITLTLLLSIAFHAADMLWYYGDFRMIDDASFLQELMLSLMSELLIGLTIALMLMGFSRHTLQGVVRELNIFTFGRPPRSGMVGTMLVTFGFAFAIAFFSVFRYIFISQSEQRPLDWTAMAVLAGTYILLGMALLGLLAGGYRSEIRQLSDAIRGLTSLRGDGIHGRVPVASPDETGQLTESFNLLQQKLQQRYEELQREIRLAYDVQQQLLPQNRWDFGFAEAAAICIQDKEVGGDLFDVAPLDEHRFFLMIGDVSGNGVSAALVMSSVMALFRTEVRYGGSPEELLARLNRHIAGTLKGSMHVTLGIALFDRSDGLRYASAGHMAPYLIRGRKLEDLAVSSLPLGLDQDYAYSSMRLELEPGDRLLFYTDGIVESVLDESGELFGFERLERLLAELPQEKEAGLQLQYLEDRTASFRLRHQDDRTYLLVRWNGGELAKQTWTIPSILGAEKTLRKDIEAICGTYGVREEQKEDMWTAVAEACINAIEHGNRCRAELTVTVRLEVFHDAFVFRIYDCGPDIPGPEEHLDLPAGNGRQPDRHTGDQTEMSRCDFGKLPRDDSGELARDGSGELPRGWGLFLMERLADRVARGIDAHGHYFRLEFQLKDFNGKGGHDGGQAVH